MSPLFGTTTSKSGPSIIWFSHTTLLEPNLSQSWAETSELLGRISSFELDPQPWHFTNTMIELVYPFLITALIVTCTLLQHPTSPALLTSPTPCQGVLVCGACIGTAQVGASLVAPFECIFKQSSLRSFRDMIIIS